MALMDLSSMGAGEVVVAAMPTDLVIAGEVEVGEAGAGGLSLGVA
jgi:hypothetical protein